MAKVQEEGNLASRQMENGPEVVASTSGPFVFVFLLVAAQETAVQGTRLLAMYS